MLKNHAQFWDNKNDEKKINCNTDEYFYVIANI